MEMTREKIMRKIALGIMFVLLSASSLAYAASGKVIIKGTKDGSLVDGQVMLTDAVDGLKIFGDIKGVPPGKHGFHIHENGSCQDEGKAAGGHFNPDQMPHGLLSNDGFAHAHAGDLGNVEIGADGSGKIDTMLKGLTLSEGKYAVLGKSIILHEKEDDFGQPTGNAGSRIGCGVIETA